ncbi:DciA family protein [Streptomyces niveiscabiei]|uniref:DciA family protein n=1 Tax=Streptomyces niveiscabiei TaxID=164115 RepID=UPI0006EB7F5C|nr:DciA family protein [Streptomyces niveiscabiei]
MTELSGVDLARQALVAAREAAKKNGATQTKKPKRRTTTVVRRDGREPMGLGMAIGALVTERAWELPAAGATLRERWEAIAPELVGHVVAVGYDPDSGRLTVCPESPAWATKVRLEQARIIEAANASAGRTVVRGLRILAPGSVPPPAPDDDVVQAPEAPKGPVKTRELASDGYHRALAAHRQAAAPSLADPGIAQAVERQTRAMRELSARAFPDPDEASASIAAAQAQRRRDAEKTRIAALRQARKDRAARQSGTAAAPQPAELRTTA